MGALRARGVVGVIFAGRARYAVLAYALRAPAARGTSAPSAASLASPAKARASAPRRRRKRLRRPPASYRSRRTDRNRPKQPHRSAWLSRGGVC